MYDVLIDFLRGYPETISDCITSFGSYVDVISETRKFLYKYPKSRSVIYRTKREKKFSVERERKGRRPREKGSEGRERKEGKVERERKGRPREKSSPRVFFEGKGRSREKSPPRKKLLPRVVVY